MSIAGYPACRPLFRVFPAERRQLYYLTTVLFPCQELFLSSIQFSLRCSLLSSSAFRRNPSVPSTAFAVKCHFLSSADRLSHHQRKPGGFLQSPLHSRPHGLRSFGGIPVYHRRPSLSTVTFFPTAFQLPSVTAEPQFSILHPSPSTDTLFQRPRSYSCKPAPEGNRMSLNNGSVTFSTVITTSVAES
jgi:hypothetical protein